KGPCRAYVDHVELHQVLSQNAGLEFLVATDVDASQKYDQGHGFLLALPLCKTSKQRAVYTPEAQAKVTCCQSFASASGLCRVVNNPGELPRRSQPRTRHRPLAVGNYASTTLVPASQSWRQRRSSLKMDRMSINKNNCPRQGIALRIPGSP